MGQPVTVIEKRSARPDIVRFETNRVLTGMGHERAASPGDARGETPAADLVRIIFEHPGVRNVHVNGNVITVQLDEGASTDGLREQIEELYTFYKDGVVPAQLPGPEPSSEPEAAEAPAPS